MRVIKYSQTETADKSTVELNFKSLGQLLDLDDPSPYPHTEVTEVAEDAIASHLGDVPIKRDVELVVSLPSSALNLEIQEKLAETIRQHFAFQASRIPLEVARKKARGKFGLRITAAIIAIILVVGVVLWLIPESDKLLAAIVEGLTAGVLTILAWAIIGGVAKTYVIECRDLTNKMKVYEKVARMNIRIKQA